MTTPPDPRVRPPTTGGERAMLEGLLDYHRETLLWKCAGLSHEQLTRRLPSSSLSLLGLVRHLTDVDRGWLEEYARHNGNADLLREAVDGVAGE